MNPDALKMLVVMPVRPIRSTLTCSRGSEKPCKAFPAKSCYYIQCFLPDILPRLVPMPDSSPVLILYSTPACHLCETAHALMAPHLAARQIDLEEVDISHSDELIEKYGIRIPVIRFRDNDRELGWPFTEEQFLGFLDAPR